MLIDRSQVRKSVKASKKDKERLIIAMESTASEGTASEGVESDATATPPAPTAYSMLQFFPTEFRIVLILVIREAKYLIHYMHIT